MQSRGANLSEQVEVELSTTQLFVVFFLLFITFLQREGA